MGILGSIFTWWNGATIGTSRFIRSKGAQVGSDELGNLYYTAGARRFVIYHGSNDASRVPPEWQSWLRGQIDDVPEKALGPKRPFQIPAQPNLTGTGETYKPAGALSRGGKRPAATGDYQAWTPE